MNAKKLQEILKDQSETPLERGVYWTEYMIRHKGAPHLRLQARNLNWFQRSLWDVYLFLAAVGIIVLLVTLTCFYFLSKKLLRHCAYENRIST